MVISKKPLTETKVLFKNNTTQLSAFIMMGASHSAENGLYNFLLISTQGGVLQLAQHLHPGCFLGGSLSPTVPAAGCILLGSRQWSLSHHLPLAQGVRPLASRWPSFPSILPAFATVDFLSTSLLNKSQTPFCGQRTQSPALDLPFPCVPCHCLLLPGHHPSPRLPPSQLTPTFCLSPWNALFLDQLVAGFSGCLASCYVSASPGSSP